MTDGLEILTHPLAAGQGLAAALLTGDAGDGLLPGAGGGGSSGQAAGTSTRLPATAFGTTGPAASERLERILAGEGHFVSTGQQPVLLLGPLYVFYKALSAIELARRLETRTGRPALALFWIASDDHDWREVARTRLVDAGNELRELRLDPPDGWSSRPVGAAPLPDRIGALLDAIAQSTPNTDFSEMYFALFRDAWHPGRTWGQAFAHSLAALLRERPLAWLDAASPAVKRAAAPLFASALERAAAAGEALESGAGRIREVGYEAPIPRLAGAADLFYDTGKERLRLYRDGGRVRAGREGAERPLEEVLVEIEAAPERFGPNVALRPVLESWLAPVGATVLGPGELAYWTQLRDLFELHGVGMPALRPRHGWLLLEAKVRKVLEKLGEEPGGFRDGSEPVARRSVRDARPPQVERALRELRSALGRALAEVETAVEEHLPGIRSAVGKAKGQAFGIAQELESQVDARLRERREVLLEQIRKAALHLYPDGSPQERVQSPLYYLVRYGPSFIDGLERRGREVTPSLWPDD